MRPLTQYGRMAEIHWREHCPKMVRELERKGLLHQMLLEAEEMDGRLRGRPEAAANEQGTQSNMTTVHVHGSGAWGS